MTFVRSKTKILAVLAVIFLSSCVYYKPQKVAYYDSECELVRKKLVLTTEQQKLFDEDIECRNEECVYMLLGQVTGKALMAPLSLIISGSIVVAGNTVYWLEKQEQCKKVN